MFCRRPRKVLGLLMEELKSSKKKFLRILLLLVLAALITVFFVYDLKQYLTLEFLQESREVIRQHYEAQPFKLLLTFFCIYLVTTTLSLPGAAALSLAGGAIFGLTIGTLMVSFASSIGATLASTSAASSRGKGREMMTTNEDYFETTRRLPLSLHLNTS